MSQNPHQLIVRDTSVGGFVRISDQLAQRIGWSCEELAERPLAEWIHPDDRAALTQALSQTSSDFSARHASRSNGWIPINWRVRNDGGRWYAFGDPRPGPATTPGPARRASDSKTAMGRMLDAMALIVEARNPGLRCSILLVDPESGCVRVGAGPSFPPEYNAAIEGMRIGPAVGSCGTAVFWNLPVVVEDIGRDPLWSDLRGVARIAGVAACWSQPILATNGDVLGAMALYDVVPNRPKQHEMNGLAIAAHMVGLAIERENLTAQLQQTAKMEALGVMAGGVAHDFNNLLGVVLGSAELMRARTRDADLQALLGDIVGAVATANGLCNQMLAFVGHGATALQTIDCSETIRALTKLLHVSLPKKVTLRLELSEGLRVFADQNQLHQVLLNLITNAAEAIGNQVGEVVVSTRMASSRSGPECIELMVTDTGCGIAPEIQQRIFDPFFSTKADGRGLGLAAVKGIVDAHGWQLRVSSSPGSGTTFTLSMPRDRREPTLAAPPPSLHNHSAVTLVLVVDDEPGVRKVISRMLEGAGMQVLQAANGMEAIDLFRAHGAEIGCVVLDLNMPGLDGEEVFLVLRTMRPDARIVVMSGYAAQETIARFRGHGVAGVLQKPISMATLLLTVGEAMATAR